MHRDLSAHLHSDECNKLVMALFQCRAEHPVSKFFGICNSLDYAMTRCLKQEMTSKREQNKERANTRLTKQQKFSIYDKFEFEEE